MKITSTKTFAKAVHEATKGKTGAELTHAISNTVLFMNKNNLFSKKNEILSHLEKEIDIDEKVVRAHVQSATLLSKKMLEELEDNLKKRYRAKRVEIDNKENKALIDGIKIETNDEVIDMTLSHKLNQLQEYLIKN